jgi:hypothetical protein
MASAIENYLYGSRGTHALVAFSIDQTRVMVGVAPWVDLNAVTEATFEAAELLSVWSDRNHTPEEIALPWDIIGFDSRELSQSRWEFVINCSVVEFCWRSEWPRQTRGCT